MFRIPPKLTITGVFAVMLSAPLAAQMTLPKSAPASGDKLFAQQCAACHSVKPGETRVGPSLAGVVGRKAGSVSGYAYSPALKASGKTWNAATLDMWLTSSTKTVPGTKMPYTQADAGKRKAIIDYLQTVK